MKTFFYLTAALLVMGLAFWAYQENYQTQAALKDSAALKRQIVVKCGPSSQIKHFFGNLVTPCASA